MEFPVMKPCWASNTLCPWCASVGAYELVHIFSGCQHNHRSLHEGELLQQQPMLNPNQMTSILTTNQLTVFPFIQAPESLSKNRQCLYRQQ